MPKVLVVCIGPHSYGKYKSNFQAVREEFISTFGSDKDRDKLNRSRVLHYIRDGVRVLFANVNEWIDSITNATSDPYYFRWDETQDRLRIGEKRGSWIMHGTGQGDFGRHPISVSESSTVQMNRLCEICSLNNIKIIIRIMPSRADEIKEKEAVEKLHTYLQELTSTWPNLTISEPIILNWEDECFHDNVHLNAEGAERMTELLTAEINKTIK